MVPLVAVSGAECIEALRLAGFRLHVAAAEGRVTLASGVRVVSVPDVAMLTPTELYAILRDAGVTYSTFLDLLSETPTDPDVSRTTGIRRRVAESA
ncbi:MAG: hypothetical protein KF819_34005 [Labilithrix sp.]|nr:hypothetical protein [Labilithrix sp.]